MAQQVPLTQAEEDALKDVFYTQGIRLGRDRLYQKIRTDYPQVSITKVQVQKWLKLEQSAAKPAGKAFGALVTNLSLFFCSIILKFYCRLHLRESSDASLEGLALLDS